jgi:hypothetical protein
MCAPRRLEVFHDLADLSERLLVVECRHLVDPLAVNSLVGFQVDDRSSAGKHDDSGVVIVAMAGIVKCLRMRG